MGTTGLVVMTLVALTNVKAVRGGWYAPYRPFRIAIRIAGVATPPFLIFGWLAALTSGTENQVFYGLALMTLVPVSIGGLGVLLAMATAPSRRR